MINLCLLSVSYGTPFPNNGAHGPSIVAYNLVKALNKYTDIKFKMFVFGSFDPLCHVQNVFRAPSYLDQDYLDQFDLIHVLNGYDPALLIIGASLCEKTIIGTNVVFNTFPVIKDQIYEKYSPKEMINYEQMIALENYICSFKWKKILMTAPEYKEEFMERFGCFESDLRVMWTGIDTELFKPDDEADKLYITWVAKDGNQNYSLMKQIVDAFPKEQFLLSGLEGRYNYFDHPKTLQRSKLFISTSEETQGIAIFEAMACGVPTITMQQHLYSDHNVNTIKVNASTTRPDSRVYIEAIESLLADPELMRKIGQNGLNYIQKNYSLERMAKLYMNILNEC